VRLVIATRRSALALAQSRAVARALDGLGHRVTLLELTTGGDRWSASGAPLPVAGDGAKGMFVKELEEALLDGRADLAVHSAKDLPTELPAPLAVLAVPPREDPHDVLVGPPGGVAALPPGARVGTSSPRRRAQIAAVRPDLDVVEIRGNVDTRLRRLTEGAVDALVLAAAGLARLGLAPAGATLLPADAHVPAPGQGLLGIEGRGDREDLRAVVAGLDDPVAHACLRAERAFLAGMGGGCSTPVGALCRPEPGGLSLRFWVADPAPLTGVVAGQDPEAIGRAAAAEAHG
jgi:hydroxymethylbilane synthase